MELINHTAYQADYSTGILPTGQYCLVVVIKATFDFPEVIGEPATLSEIPVEIFDADTFFGEPGYSSTLHENDYATKKPFCDVIINSDAHSPSEKSVEHLVVSAKVGSMMKSFLVMGNRKWKTSGLGLSPSEPEPFTRTPINWEVAFGGTDHDEKNDDDTAYLQNPIGLGFRKSPKKSNLKETAIATTIPLSDPTPSYSKNYLPQGFGTIGRNWLPRTQYTGTYDETWVKERKPFLPDDFDERYYQCAPEDQQIPYPKGGEQVALKNLSKKGIIQFKLPILNEAIQVTDKQGKENRLQTVVDTITLNTTDSQVTLVARIQVPFIHSIKEIKQIMVGQAPKTTDAPAKHQDDSS